MTSQLSISIINAAASNASVVYTGQSNTVDLQLLNAGTNDIILSAGTPEDSTHPSGFNLQISFASMFGGQSDPCADLAVSAEGWQATYFPNGEYPVWSVSPTAEITLSAGQATSITVSGLTPTSSPGSYSIKVDVYNLPGVGSSVVSCPVAVQSPGVGKTLQGLVSCAVTPGTVGITRDTEHPVVNTLKLTLSNISSQPLVTGDWGTQQPSFKLTFVYPSLTQNWFALTTQDLANKITVGLGEGTTGWTVNTPASPTGPVWSLEPQFDQNSQILAANGTGPQAMALFEIDNLITTFNAVPTQVVIQYVDVPGYDDGYLVCNNLLLDYPPMAITQPLTANSDTVVLDPDTGTANAYLNWAVTGATMVELSGVGQVAPSEQNRQVSITGTTTFVLTAYDTYQSGNGSASWPPLQRCATTVKALAPNSSPSTPISMLLGQALPVGAVVPWSGTADNVPSGFSVCDGGIMQISGNQALYAVIGSTYGGDGLTTFALPDLTERFIMGTGASGQAPGQSGSSVSHGHTLTQIPPVTGTTSVEGSHTHGIPASWHTTKLASGDDCWSIDTTSSLSSDTAFQSAGAHSHAISVIVAAGATSTWTGAVRPMWFSLCYLIRTGT